MGKHERVGVWHCDHCEQFHVKAGNVLLSFDREEFSEFVGSAWDCYYGQQSGEFDQFSLAKAS